MVYIVILIFLIYVVGIASVGPPRDYKTWIMLSILTIIIIALSVWIIINVHMNTLSFKL